MHHPAPIYSCVFQEPGLLTRERLHATSTHESCEVTTKLVSIIQLDFQRWVPQGEAGILT